MGHKKVPDELVSGLFVLRMPMNRYLQSIKYVYANAQNPSTLQKNGQVTADKQVFGYRAPI